MTGELTPELVPVRSKEGISNTMEEGDVGM